MVERFKHCCSSIPLYPVTVRVGGPKLDVAAGVDDDSSPGDVSHNGGFFPKKNEPLAAPRPGEGSLVFFQTPPNCKKPPTSRFPPPPPPPPTSQPPTPTPTP